MGKSSPSGSLSPSPELETFTRPKTINQTTTTTHDNERRGIKLYRVGVWCHPMIVALLLIEL